MLALSEGGRRVLPEATAALHSALAALVERAGGAPANTTTLRPPRPLPTFAPLFASPAAGGPGEAAAWGEARRLACALAVRLCDVLIPPAFTALPAGPAGTAAGAATAAAPPASVDLQLDQATLMDASVAPGGGAALSLRGGSPAAAGPGGPLQALAALPLPLASAPELLDPCLSGLALIAAASAPAPADVLAALRHLAGARDAVGARRGPLRLLEAVGPPPSVRQLAPLLEDPSAAKPGKGGIAQQAAAARKAGGAAAAAEDDAAAREELRQLQRQRRREMRGAARELKRDREFVVRATDAKAATRDAERTQNLRSLMTLLEEQQRTAKEAVRGAKHGGVRGHTAEASKSMLHVGRTKADRVAGKQRGKDAVGGGGGARGPKPGSPGAKAGRK